MLKHVQISPLRNRSDSMSMRSSTSCASSICGSPEPPNLDMLRTPSRASSYSSLNETLPQTTIKVFTTCLRIDIEYKTLGIQWDTSSKEVIAQLLRRLKMRHRDPRLFYLSMEVTVRRAGVKTVLVLDDEARPAILQACHPKGDSRFCLQLRPGGLIRVHTSALQSSSQYKSLVISQETTSDELLCILLSCYNSIEPVEQFSLYEVCPGQEYQRKLHPDDIPLKAQNERIQRGETCHFLVRRNPNYPRRRQVLSSCSPSPSTALLAPASISKAKTNTQSPNDHDTTVCGNVKAISANDENNNNNDSDNNNNSNSSSGSNSSNSNSDEKANKLKNNLRTIVKSMPLGGLLYLEQQQQQQQQKQLESQIAKLSNDLHLNSFINCNDSAKICNTSYDESKNNCDQRRNTITSAIATSKCENQVQLFEMNNNNSNSSDPTALRVCNKCRNTFKSCEFCQQNSSAMILNSPPKSDGSATSNIDSTQQSLNNQSNGQPNQLLKCYNPVYNIREIRTASHSFSSFGNDKKIFDIDFGVNFLPLNTMLATATATTVKSESATKKSVLKVPVLSASTRKSTNSTTSSILTLLPFTGKSNIAKLNISLATAADASRNASDKSNESTAIDTVASKVDQKTTTESATEEVVNDPAKGLGHFVYI